MKKIISLILALTMILALAVSASASTIPNDGTKKLNSTNNTASSDIKINVSVATNPVYNVDVAWDKVEFTYNFNAGVWDVENHVYNSADTAWNNETGKITLKNHSNDAVNYTIHIENSAADGGDAAIVWVTDANVDKTGTLATADAGESLGNFSKAPSVEHAYQPTGTPSSTTANGTVMATITVTIEAA